MNKLDKLQVNDVLEMEKPVPDQVRHRTGKKSLTAAEVWDFGAPVPEIDPQETARATIFAHEVINSLTAIGCSLQFVKAELEAHCIDNPILTKVVRGALAEIDGVGSLVHEYCGGGETEPPAWKLADVATLVDEVIALQAIVYQASGIVVDFEREVALPWVRLDSLKIKQVITNLCKNAYEAMPRGGQLMLKTFRAGQTVALEVSDTGIGMPRGVNVFELFKTTKPNGHGVGLALAQEIMSAHHGSIVFTSEPNRGTTFRISLPIDQSARAPNAVR